MENSAPSNKSTVIRSIYFYLASFITLGIVIGSLIFLVSLGLRGWVFTDADPDLYRTGPPPSLYLDGEGRIDNPFRVADEAITCNDECELTASHLSTIEQWEGNYQLWEARRDNPNGDRARNAINAISFLIIALPFYLIHFRVAQRDAKKRTQEPSAIRTTYFYLVSLAALLMIVIAGGNLINSALKTWVFPSAGEAEKVERYAEPLGIKGGNEGVLIIINCAGDCELSDETVTRAERWLVDMDAWRQATNTYDRNQRKTADTIPYVALGIPLFWYHWRQVRREKQSHGDKPTVQSKEE